MSRHLGEKDVRFIDVKFKPLIPRWILLKSQSLMQWEPSQIRYVNVLQTICQFAKNHNYCYMLCMGSMMVLHKSISK